MYKVGSPKTGFSCPMTWDKLEHLDDEKRIRVCSKCNQKVYDFLHLSQNEAKELVEKSEGSTDVEYVLREDGMFMIKECPLGTNKLSSNKMVYLLLLAVVAMIIFKYKDVGHTCGLGSDSNGKFNKADGWVTELD